MTADASNLINGSTLLGGALQTSSPAGISTLRAGSPPITETDLTYASLTHLSFEPCPLTSSGASIPYSSNQAATAQDPSWNISIMGGSGGGAGIGLRYSILGDGGAYYGRCDALNFNSFNSPMKRVIKSGYNQYWYMPFGPDGIFLHTGASSTSSDATPVGSAFSEIITYKTPTIISSIGNPPAFNSHSQVTGAFLPVSFTLTSGTVTGSQFSSIISANSSTAGSSTLNTITNFTDAAPTLVITIPQYWSYGGRYDASTGLLN
jgi:hypothetical protein